MSLLWLIGWVLLAFVAPIDAEKSVTGSTLSVSDFSTWAGVHTANESGISTTRFLRASAVVDNDDDTIEDDGEERAGLSVPIADKVKIFLSSSKVTPGRLQKWLTEEKPADTVFARMRLDKVDEYLLLHLPQFTDWLKYVDDLSAKNPTKGTSAVSTLAAHYGDAGLYKMIGRYMYAGPKDLATKLQKELMQHWLATAKAPDDVFHAMKLDKVGDNILSNPEFTAWAKYVEDFNAKYPEQPALMAPALRKYYSDGALFKMTDEVISGEGFKSVATKIQDELIHLWLSSRKTPDDALVELGLGKTADTLMESPLFDIWLKYTNAYSTKYPREKSTVIETLTRKFDDAAVARLLYKAKTTTGVMMHI